jgi:transposase
MTDSDDRLVSPPVQVEPTEGFMLREDVVRAVLARLERGEHVKTVARELGIDPKTVRRWRRLGGWQPRRPQKRARQLERFEEFLTRRAPEVGWNGRVLYREVQGLGFRGGYLQVQRFLQPFRDERRWAACASVRFETDPGEQAQIDFGQLPVWIGERCETVHLLVVTLGFSRRTWVRAYPHERLAVVLDGHERAFRHFGGVPLECLYDNPRTLVTGRRESRVQWHPVFADFARYYSFTPRACQPYRARTKGKVESGIKYVKRNALAGRRFGSWDGLNTWLEAWCTTIADVRIHGTTHERPIDRFGREGLTPVGGRAPYRFEHVRIRQVPTDALVAIAAARYSVPVEYVGTTVTVHETATHFEIFSEATCIARHTRAARFAVVIDPAHYAGLLRMSPRRATLTPPQWDLTYRGVGDVAVRDLSVYAALAEMGGMS